ncbi:U3 snoRNP protein [Malassezia psittaci]|uniref:U3 snoRNP protein n=1 Tax=Malassezia psittaci TaxID=1821823 RepID=A0AAF0JF71_9BASI|nr:U3 snoRNP protein [Malassezia psittaci]
MSEAGRFKYRSFHERLRDVSIDLARESESSWGASRLRVAGLDAPASAFAAAMSGMSVDRVSSTEGTAFGAALHEWSELNLSLPFQAFHNEVYSKSQSLPLLLHHRDEITDALDRFLTLESQNWLAWDAFLDLVPRFAFDLGPEFLPVYPRMLTALLRASSLMNKNLTKNDEALAARLVERAFHSAAWLFRAIQPSLNRADNAALMLESWSIVRQFLDPSSGQIKDHTRRFVLEAFAHLVRKAPRAKLMTIVPQMLQDANCAVLEDAVAATLANSCVTTANVLHSRTPELLQIFLKRSEHPERLRRIGSATFTALAHHTKAPQMQKAIEVLVEWIKPYTSQATSSDRDSNGVQLETLLVWLTYAIGTRKGTRVDDAIKPSLFSTMTGVYKHGLDSNRSPALLQTYCTLFALILPLGRIQDTAKPGGSILKDLARQPAERDLVESWPSFRGTVLSLSSWTGFRAFVLPSVIESTLALLEADRERSDAALLLLAELNEQGHLEHLHTAPPTSNSLKWLKKIRKVIKDRLMSIENVDASLLAVIKLAPGFCTHAESQINSLVQAIQSRVPVANDQDSKYICAMLSGVLVLARSQHCVELLEPLFASTPSSIQQLLKLESPDILVTLAELVAEGAKRSWQLPNEDASFTLLRPRLLSADRAIVSATLQTLAVLNSNQSFNVYDRLHKVEMLPLDVSNITSRNVKLRQVQREAFQALRGSDAQLMALISYTIGTFKLNLRPIWKESRTTLIALASRLPDPIWNETFKELGSADTEIMVQTASVQDIESDENESDSEEQEDNDREKLSAASENPSQTTALTSDESSTNVGSDGQQESTDQIKDQMELADAPLDPALDDPQLRSRLKSLYHLFSQKSLDDLRETFLQPLFTEKDLRYNPQTYADQLLCVYEEHAVLVEKHSESFMNYVLAQWPKLSTNSGIASVKVRMNRLERYLDIFSAVRHPANLHASDNLWTELVKLCAYPELPIQRGAFSCLCGWKFEWLEHHAERIRALLDPAKFRDALAQMDLRVDHDMFASHRGDIMPIVIRLLYGLMVSKRAARTSGAGQHARRSAILNALFDCDPAEFHLLVDLMLQAFPEQREAHKDSFQPIYLTTARVRQQSGLLTFLGDVLRRLGQKLGDEMTRLMEVVISITIQARNDSVRSVYRLGLRRLADAVRYCSAPDWNTYATTLLNELVYPRLDTFAEDSVQSPSAMLDLIQAWAHRQDTLRIFLSSSQVLAPVYASLKHSSIKPAVAHAILDIAEHTVNEKDLIKASVSWLLQPLSSLVKHTIHSEFTYSLGGVARDDLLRREMALLTSLGKYMEQSQDAAATIKLLVPLMRHSSRSVPERTKLELLKTFETLLPLAPLDSAVLSDLVTLFSRLGSELRTSQARVQYALAFAQLVPLNPSLERAARWVQSLNAYTYRAVDEIDFDSRLSASDEILQSNTRPTHDEWHVLLYHALLFVTDTEELAMRTMGSAILYKFLREDAKKNLTLVQKVFMPGIRRRLHSRSETVRKEMFGLLGESVTQLSTEIPALQELQCLFVGGDEEASVFSNLYHIQVHRRIRALHRIAEFAEQGKLRSRTLSELFIPLAWYFLQPNASGGYDMNMVNEALTAIKRMASKLQWNHYYHWLSRSLREMKEHTAKEEPSAAERLYVRGTVGLLEAFHFDLSGDAIQSTTDDELDRDGQEMDVEDSHTGSAERSVETDIGLDAIESSADAASDRNAQQANPLKNTLAIPLGRSPEVIPQIVTDKVLPELHKAIDTKEEDRLPIRLPLIVGAARLAKFLPDERRRTELFKTFASLAMAFRSKLQSTRDTAREIGSQLIRAVGIEYFPPLVHELRRTLTRGPQRAVCAFTVHNLLVTLSNATPSAPPLLVSLNAGVKDMIATSIDDLFGETSEDREAIGNKIKAKEVKQSKSLDTFEQVARLAIPSRLNSILTPVRDILSTTSTPKAVRVSEECLRRVASGINSNDQVDAQSLLVLCHSLIARGVSALGDSSQNLSRGNGKRRKEKHSVLVSRKQAEHTEYDHLSQNAYVFVDLGLDMLSTAIKRSRFDVHDQETIAKLMPLLPAVGETLYARHTEVVQRGLRTAAALSRLNLPNSAQSMPVIQRQILSILRHTGGLHSEVAQAAVRAFAVMLRECKQVAPQEQQLTELLRLVTAELDDAEVQATIFALLRAMVARALVVPEMYDVMDRIAELLVTSYDAQVREVCRALYLQFLLDYPQGKGRLSNQLQYLARNLAYEVESGRLSVLTLLSAVITKFSPEVIESHAELFFVALVMQVSNDDSTRCKQKAADTLGILFNTINENVFKHLSNLTHRWAIAPPTSTQTRQLNSVALRVYDVALNRPDGYQIATEAFEAVRRSLKEAADEMRDIEENLGDESDSSWRTTYHALQTLQSLYQKDAKRTAALQTHDTTQYVVMLLTYPHAWVRIASCRVIGAMFAAPTAMDRGMQIHTMKQLVAQLYGATLDDALTLQVVRNLVFLGKKFADSMPIPDKPSDDQIDVTNTENASDLDAKSDTESQSSVSDNSEQDKNQDDSEDIAEDASIANDVSDEEVVDDAEENPLAWLFSRMSHAARFTPRANARDQDLRRISAIFKWFAAISTQISPEILEMFLVHILSPIQRITDDDSVEETHRTLAAEVQELIQSRVSATSFTRAYAHVRQAILTNRRERRNHRLMQNVMDPERAAKRRHTRNLHKHESRKRKNGAFRNARQRNVRPRTRS